MTIHAYFLIIRTCQSNEILVGTGNLCSVRLAARVTARRRTISWLENGQNMSVNCKSKFRIKESPDFQNQTQWIDCDYRGIQSVQHILKKQQLPDISGNSPSYHFWQNMFVTTRWRRSLKHLCHFKANPITRKQCI